MTNLLGFSRTGDAIVAHYEEALQSIINAGMVKEEDGLLSAE